jgi:penicillin-insensitive murein endopeptidase
VANLPFAPWNFAAVHAFTKFGGNWCIIGKSLPGRRMSEYPPFSEENALNVSLFRSAIVALSLLASTVTAMSADGVPAKQLFGKVTLPTKGQTQSLGFYAKGCLAGGVAIPVDGPAWQVLHLSRNRRWGNPEMIALLERLSRESRAADGWSGLLVGDISQPRGGPMLTGHASHQIGLDADIWLTPMPDRRLSYEEREAFPENSVLRKGTLRVDPNKWTPAHARLIMRAASYRNVERVFVHPGIKKKLCESWKGDPALLSKVRPIYGHHYHFHIRMKCPAGSLSCEDQVDPPADSGCGKPLAEWFEKLKPRPAPKVAVDKKKPAPKPKFMTLAALPKACAIVLNAKSVTSMAAAEFGRPADANVASAETAYAEQVPVVAVNFRSIDDFSPFIPALGSVPVPDVRPSGQ